MSDDNYNRWRGYNRDIKEIYSDIMTQSLQVNVWQSTNQVNLTNIKKGISQGGAEQSRAEQSRTEPSYSLLYTLYSILYFFSITFFVYNNPASSLLCLLFCSLYRNLCLIFVIIVLVKLVIGIECTPRSSISFHLPVLFQFSVCKFTITFKIVKSEAC